MEIGEMISLTLNGMVIGVLGVFAVLAVFYVTLKVLSFDSGKK